MIVKNKDVHIRLSEKEYSELLLLAESSGICRDQSGKINMSSYIRHCIFDSAQSINQGEEIKELKYKIRQMETIVNQTAKKIQYDYPVSHKAFLLELQELRKDFTQLLEKME